jgi:hypothetical protein
MDEGGRWVFQNEGQTFPVEVDLNLSAKRTRDRFTSNDLNRLLESQRIPVLTEERLRQAPTYALIYEKLFNIEAQRRIEDSACSLQEARDPSRKMN